MEVVDLLVVGLRVVRLYVRGRSLSAGNFNGFILMFSILFHLLREELYSSMTSFQFGDQGNIVGLSNSPLNPPTKCNEQTLVHFDRFFKFLFLQALSQTCRSSFSLGSG